MSSGSEAVTLTANIFPFGALKTEQPGPNENVSIAPGMARQAAWSCVPVHARERHGAVVVSLQGFDPRDLPGVAVGIGEHPGVAEALRLRSAGERRTGLHCSATERIDLG